MKRIASILAVVAFAAAALPARAALDGYIMIKGSKQGQFKGSGKSKSNRIGVISIDHSIVSPRDPQSGLPTGQRMHKPVVFTVAPADAAEFKLALANGELLPAVQIEFIRPAGAGKVEIYHTIALTDAHVGSVKPLIGPGSGPKPIEITLTYTKFVVVNTAGKVQATDDWLAAGA
jgi:type VI secretion system secreted protein Hcp